MSAAPTTPFIKQVLSRRKILTAALSLMPFCSVDAEPDDSTYKLLKIDDSLTPLKSLTPIKPFDSVNPLDPLSDLMLGYFGTEGGPSMPAINKDGLPIRLSDKPKINTSAKPTIYLTVDDGWKNQQDIIHSFSKNKAVGTFYLTGQALRAHSKVWHNALEQGMEFGGHSENHHPASRLTETQFRDDLEQYKRSAKNVLGSQWMDYVNTFRYPYGDSGGKNKQLFARILFEECGWVAMGWDLDLSFTHEGRKFTAWRNVEAPINHFKTRQHEGMVILMHFLKNDSSVLEALLERYSQTYQFQGVSVLGT